jgi:hypothetical protein
MECLLREIWKFLRLVAGKWASLVTGAFSALLVLLGLGISIVGAFGIKIPSDSIIQLATWTLAAVCCGYAAFSVWHREHVEKEKLQAKLMPNLKFSYEPSKSQCRSISTFIDHVLMAFDLEVHWQ